MKKEKFRINNAYWVMMLCVVLLPLSTLAEETEEIGKPQATLEEVVVTATKTEEKRKDVSNSVVVVDSEEIQESTARSIGELLGNKMGIDWHTYGNYGGASEMIYIRGMDASGTQVLINGVSINSPSLGTADISGIPANAIDRIEIVKGAGSLLYGSGAMGGTVNIITKQPEHDQIDARFLAGYGTENTYQLSAEQGMFVGQSLGYYLTANRRETDGFRDNSDLTHNDISLNLIYDKIDEWKINIYGDYMDRDFGQPGVQPPEDTDDYYVNGQKMYNNEAASLVNHHEDEKSHAALTITNTSHQTIHLTFKSDYTNMESYNYTRYSSSGTGDESWVTNTIYGIQGYADVRMFKNSNLLVGMEQKDYDYNNEQGYLDEFGRPVPGSSTSEDYFVSTQGYFAEAGYRPMDFFKVQAGIRHERHEMFGSENLFQYGLLFNIKETTAIKLSSGKHFAAPTMNDLFWPDDGSTKGNPDLKPETGWHSDITIEQGLLDNKIFMTCSVFKWNIKDKITWAETTEPSEWEGYYYWAPSNTDTYEAAGGEAGVRFGPMYHSIISISYTYIDATEELQFGAERQATNSTDHLFKGEYSYFTDFGMTLTATTRYVGERPSHYALDTDTEPDHVLDAYVLCDLKINQRLYDHWIISLQGNNLFDEAYYTNASRFTDSSTGDSNIEGYPGAGRSFFVSISYEL